MSKEDLTPPLHNRIIRLAAFQNPEFYRAQAMRLSTFGKPRIISCCEDFPGYISLPRGCLEEIVELLRSLKIDTELLDQRFTGAPIEVKFLGTLRPEQHLAAEALLRQDIEVMSVSTAFCKTVIGIYLIAERSVNTLVIVHRRQLLDQWMAALSTFLNIDSKQLGQIGAGKRRPFGKIDVAMIQSLIEKGVVDDLVGEYGHVVVDKCHHISAASFEAVIRQSKAKYVMGLTATTIRKDGHHPIIFMQCGPIRYRADNRQQALARPFSHRVILFTRGRLNGVHFKLGSGPEIA